MSYQIIDPETLPAPGMYRQFTQTARCSASITNRMDVTQLQAFSKRTGTKFYLNFLYLLCRVLNSRPVYRLGWRYPENQLVEYDQINPTQYVFHDDTQTFTVVYTQYSPDYAAFYQNALADLEAGMRRRDYGLDEANHPNWFDASYLPWVSYEGLHLELPDGYPYYAPIVNWGKYRREGSRLTLPLTVRLNHAVADGYAICRVFTDLQAAMDALTGAKL